MKILLCITTVVYCLHAVAISKQPPLFTVKIYSIKESKKLAQTTVFKSSNPTECVEFLSLAEASAVFFSTALENPLRSYCEKLVPCWDFPQDSLQKNFGKILNKETKSVAFVLDTAEKEPEKKRWRKHQQWIRNFYKNHPEKTVFILKIAPKKAKPEPLPVFHWLPSNLGICKQYCFCMTAAESRSSCFEHVFCHL